MSHAPDRHARLRITGERNVEGDLAAKGSLEFRIADAAKASFLFDYREDSRLVLGVRSTAGFRIGGDARLTLSGGVQRDLTREEWKGDVKAEIELGKDIEVVIHQAFVPKGNTTSVALTVTF